jgi:hypothetical protein
VCSTAKSSASTDTGSRSFGICFSGSDEPGFMAFDILWDEHPKSDDEEEMRRFRIGEDLRYLPLIDRKLRLHAEHRLFAG